MNITEYGFYELENSELNTINGGSWLSYAIGYACGILHNVGEAWSSTPEGMAAQQALRDFQ